MAWETPKTWASEPLTSVDLNEQVRDNLNYLKDRVDAVAGNYHRLPAGSYSTTSTSSVDMDATNLSHTITTTGGDIRVTFTGYGRVTGAGGQNLNLSVDIDSTEYVVLSQENYTSLQEMNSSFSWIISGLSAGEHTVKMVWHVTSGTGQMYAATFDVREDIGIAA